MNITNKIEPNKYYSIRQTAKLIPWIHSKPTLQKIIHTDIDENKNQLFKTFVLKRNKQKRYYIKGAHILEVMKKMKSGILTITGTKIIYVKNSKK